MRHYLLLICFLSCLGCGSEKAGLKRPPVGFYYWSTKYNPSDQEKLLLRQTECKRLYTRFFDLECSYSDDERYTFEPAGRLVNSEPFDSTLEIVPVVYITECAISRMDLAEERETYASLMLGKINRMLHRHGAKPAKEYQLDCDWTESTRENYFEFIKTVKEKVKPAIVSVTLRLYPYKYRTKAGVPPADRAMLMYYNMGEIKSVNDKSFILDNSEGSKYIKGLPKYPLPLDFALPLYNQGRVVTVNAESNYLRELISPEELKERTKDRGMVKVGKQRWAFLEYLDMDKRKAYLSDTDGYRESMSGMNYTDVLISDQYSKQDLLNAGIILSECVNNKNYHVVFYHLDQLFTEKYKANELEEIVALVR